MLEYWMTVPCREGSKTRHRLIPPDVPAEIPETDDDPPAADSVVDYEVDGQMFQVPETIRTVWIRGAKPSRTRTPGNGR